MPKTHDPTWKPRVGESVLLERSGFTSQQRIIGLAKNSALCSGGWRFLLTDDGWRWDVNRSDDPNPTYMKRLGSSSQ